MRFIVIELVFAAFAKTVAGPAPGKHIPVPEPDVISWVRSAVRLPVKVLEDGAEGGQRRASFFRELFQLSASCSSSGLVQQFSAEVSEIFDLRREALDVR